MKVEEQWEREKRMVLAEGDVGGRKGAMDDQSQSGRQAETTRRIDQLHDSPPYTGDTLPQSWQTDHRDL